MSPEYQTHRDKQDQDHLNLLVILFRVFGGLSFLGICFGGFYLFIGIMATTNPSIFEPKNGINQTAMMSTMFIVIGSIASLLSAVMGIMFFVAANWIRDRRNWTGIFVMSVIACLNVPLGTVLGVFSLTVLTRESVKTLFNA